jgi:hypothetical protein
MFFVLSSRKDATLQGPGSKHHQGQEAAMTRPSGSHQPKLITSGSSLRLGISYVFNKGWGQHRIYSMVAMIDYFTMAQ